MPFSWKNKTRRNRFSQLVADHLQSPKRRPSLVLETGFPTSLIDLYVRNRGRFRNSSEKKQTPNQSSGDSDCRQTDEITQDEIKVEDYRKTEAELSVGMEKLNQSPSRSLVDLNILGSSDSDYRRTDEISEEGAVLVDSRLVASDGEFKIGNDFETEAERGVLKAKLNPVLVVAVKVWLMLVLAFGTKRFRTPITLLAFLLFFLESVGTRISTKPSVDLKQTATLVVCSEVLEIEEQDDSNQEDKSGEESDEVSSEVLIEILHKSSRRVTMKSRIRKLIPKKLRKSSVDSKHEMCRGFNEDEAKSAQNVKPLVCSHKRSESKGRRSLSSTLSSETECNDEDLQWNSGCSVLFLIVLVGLIGGRVLALVIVLSWCLMLKLQWRNVKLPIS